MATGALPQAATRPALFWVTGHATDAGKTTLAAALLRVLTRHGVPAAGFKPYTAMRLHEAVDQMLEPRSPDSPPCCVPLPHDATLLAQASPLTESMPADLVGPAQAIGYPGWLDVMMVRVGTLRLGNQRYLKSAALDAIAQRADIRTLAAASGWPVERADLRTDLDALQLPAYAQDAVRSAHAALLALGAHSLVCEGAAMYAPVWQGSPPVDHLLHIGRGNVHLVTHLGLEVGNGPQDSLRPVNELLQALPQPMRSVQAPLPLAATSQRAQVAERLVESLLRAAF